MAAVDRRDYAAIATPVTSAQVRAAVAKAAQAMIRDEIKSQWEKAKAASAKDKARKPASRAKTVPAAAPKSVVR